MAFDEIEDCPCCGETCPCNYYGEAGEDEDEEEIEESD